MSAQLESKNASRELTFFKYEITYSKEGVIPACAEKGILLLIEIHKRF